MSLKSEVCTDCAVKNENKYCSNFQASQLVKMLVEISEGELLLLLAIILALRVPFN